MLGCVMLLLYCKVVLSNCQHFDTVGVDIIANLITYARESQIGSDCNNVDDLLGKWLCVVIAWLQILGF